MMEYTISVIFGIIILIILDYFLKTEVLKPNKGKIIFWSCGIIFWYLMELVAMNRWWVVFPKSISGIYLGFGIPIEELGCLIFWYLLILVPWEYFKKIIKY